MKRFIGIALILMLFFSLGADARRRWARPYYYDYYPGWYGYYYDGNSINGYAWPPPARITYKAYFQQNRGNLDELYSLEARKAATDSFIKELSLITVSDSYITAKGSKIFAEITINNNSRFEIKKFFFSGAVTSSADQKMTNDSFEFEPANGLLPLNKANYSVPVEKFKQWCTDLCVFSVKVTGIETSDGQILKADSFSKQDEQRLEQLRNEYR